MPRADSHCCQRGPGGAARQEAALLTENVEVGRGDLGERKVDFAIYGWFPDHLPSEADDDGSELSEDGGEE